MEPGRNDEGSEAAEAPDEAAEGAEPRRAVLVTGAAGYIGRLLVRALAQDRRSLERIVALDVRAMTAAEALAGVTPVKMDIRDPGLADLLVEHAIDTVVHLASIVRPGPASSREEQYGVDVLGTKHLLEACLTAGVRKLIVTSSGAAYGYHADNAPLLTEDDPLRGNEAFPYAHHKRLVEQLLAEHRTAHPELEQLVFRPGTVLGDGVKSPISDLFEKPVILGVRGSASPFVFIWDQDVVACLERGVHGNETGVFNLAGDGVMTLREVAARLGKRYVALPAALLSRALRLLSQRGWTQYGPEQVAFLRYRPVLSNERLKAVFGYRPQLSSRQVFERYCESRS